MYYDPTGHWEENDKYITDEGAKNKINNLGSQWVEMDKRAREAAKRNDKKAVEQYNKQKDEIHQEVVSIRVKCALKGQYQDEWYKIKEVEKPTYKYNFKTREDWGAAEPKIEGRSYEKISQDYNTIAIHHTGRSQTESLQSLQKNEQKAGYADIPYHFVIGKDGTVSEGRSLNIKGTHVAGANTGKIGIVMTGNFDNTGGIFQNVADFFQGANLTTPSNQQIESLKNTIEILKVFYPQIDTVAGHTDLQPDDKKATKWLLFRPPFRG